MNKKIKNIAKLVLKDYEYILLNKYLLSNKLNQARLLVTDILDNKELELDMLEDNLERSDIINDIQNLDTLLNEIFNLYEKENEREQIKHTSE